MARPDVEIITEALRAVSNGRRQETSADMFGEPIHSFHLPTRPDLTHILDPNHLPTTTEFETVVLMPGLARLRSKHPREFPPALREFQGTLPDHWLHTISGAAKSKLGYDRERGLTERTKYLNVMKFAMAYLRDKTGHFNRETIVPVKRAGANIAGAMGFDLGLAIEAKRLRLQGAPDLLAIGVNLPDGFEAADRKPIALMEACLASGSTIAGFLFAARNRGLVFPSVSSYSVFASPAGASYLKDIRDRLDTGGHDFTVLPGDELNRNWYIVYSQDSPLLARFPEVAKKLGLKPGDQIGGDAGDLTTL